MKISEREREKTRTARLQAWEQKTPEGQGRAGVQACGSDKRRGRWGRRQEVLVEGGGPYPEWGRWDTLSEMARDGYCPEGWRKLIRKKKMRNEDGGRKEAHRGIVYAALWKYMMSQQVRRYADCKEDRDRRY